MAECANLATQADISAILGAINGLAAKIPDDIATGSHIAGLESQIAQLSQRVANLESELSDTKAELSTVRVEQENQGGFLSRIPDLLENLWSKISGFLNELSESISNGINQVWESVKDLASFLADKIGDLFNWIGDRARWVWDKITDVSSFIAGKIGDVFNWIGDRAQWVWDKIEAVAGFLGGKIGDVFNWIGDRARWVWDKIEAVGGFLGGKIGDVFNWIGDRAQYVWDKIEAVAGSIGRKLSELAGGIEILDDRLTSGLSQIISPLNAIRVWVGSTGEYLGNITGQIWEVVRGLAGAIADKIWDAVRWLLDRITEWFSSNYSGSGGVIGGGGGGGTTCQFSPTQSEDLTEGLNHLKTELGKLTGFLLGGLDSEQKLTTNYENELRAWVGEIFSPDLSAGVSREIVNLKEMLLAIAAVGYGRSGFQDYPISVPALPLNPESEPIDIVCASRFQSWQTRFIDNGIGLFPFELTIRDSDLVKVGNQEINLKFPNIAETLAEMFGFLVINKSLTEVNSQLGVKCLGELGALRKQGYLSHKLISAIVSYLGFKTKQKKEKIGLSFNPLVGIDGSDDSFAEALKPKEVDIVFEVEDEDKSLEDKLATILESAAIIRAVHFEKLNDNNSQELIDEYKGMKTDESPENEFDNFIEEFEQGFITRANITDQLNPYGRSFDRRPRVKELGDQAEQTQ